jgi:subtilisin-like proprotein convertase family protein
MRTRDWTLTLGIGLALPFVVVACGDDSTDSSIGEKADDLDGSAEKADPGKADAWNYRNNPSGLGVTMEVAWDELKDHNTGESEIRPWPASYWPTYMDSYNHRWQSTGDYLTDLSPAEKYDVAFNGWDPEDVRDLTPFDGRNCAVDGFDEDYYTKLGPVATYTSLNKGNKRTRAAIKNNELDTGCSDKTGDDENDRGGVETWWGLCHAWAPAALLEKEPLHVVYYNGVRFDISDIKALIIAIYDRSSSTLIGGRCNDKDVDRDEDTGRVNNSECRDLNPGSFHVSMVNLLGKMKRGFVEDRTFDYQVWNQPVSSYDITLQEEITKEQAVGLLKLETGSDYVYNQDAKRFIHVKTTLYWITESHASTEPEGENNHPQYKRDDRYDYILELDGNDRVVGGEWLGRSNTSHPDFIWMSTAPRGGNPHIDIEKVRMLNGFAQDSLHSDPPDNGGGDEPTGDIITAEYDGGSVAIPDNDARGASASVDVGDDTTATELKAKVEITHTYIGDLIIKLAGPNGQSFTLHEKEGGSTDNISKTYSVTPSGSIAGTWTLHVTDTYRIDTGSITGLRLNFVIGDISGGGGGGGGSAPTVIEETSNRSALIPDNDTTNGAMSYIDVSEGGTVKGVEVSVDITHTYISDLLVYLKKGAVTKQLWNREGGSSDDIVKTWTIDEFNGGDASGRWFLIVKDAARLDQGTRNSWGLKIQL